MDFKTPKYFRIEPGTGTSYRLFVVDAPPETGICDGTGVGFVYVVLTNLYNQSWGFKKDGDLVTDYVVEHFPKVTKFSGHMLGVIIGAILDRKTHILPYWERELGEIEFRYFWECAEEARRQVEKVKREMEG